MQKIYQTCQKHIVVQSYHKGTYSLWGQSQTVYFCPSSLTFNEHLCRVKKPVWIGGETPCHQKHLRLKVSSTHDYIGHSCKCSFLPDCYHCSRNRCIHGSFWPPVVLEDPRPHSHKYCRMSLLWVGFHGQSRSRHCHCQFLQSAQTYHLARFHMHTWTENNFNIKTHISRTSCSFRF